MARTQTDKRVSEALRALIGPREDSIRELAEALETIESTDAKITALLAERETQVEAGNAAIETAKAAGWKARELANAGLTIPRTYTPPAPPTQPAGGDSASQDPEPPIAE